MYVTYTIILYIKHVYTYITIYSTYSDTSTYLRKKYKYFPLIAIHKIRAKYEHILSGSVHISPFSPESSLKICLSFIFIFHFFSQVSTFIIIKYQHYLRRRRFLFSCSHNHLCGRPSAAVLT